MSPSLKFYAISSALLLSVIGGFIWWKKKKFYVKAGRVSKLFFYPVKSLRGFEVTEGKCTKLGLEVNGVIDRSFMLLNDESAVITQEKSPRLILLTPRITGKNLFISGPSGDELKVEIRDSVSSDDKMIPCRLYFDSFEAADCGEEAAAWFQSFLETPGIRLVRWFPNTTFKKQKQNHPFSGLKRTNNLDTAALHMVSQASFDDLNSRLTEKVPINNFRPNVLIDGIGPYEEDAWKYIKLDNGVEMFTYLLAFRCLITTNDSKTGVFSKKEPLVTLRKYRISQDPFIRKTFGAVPCFGIYCDVLKPGEIKVGDDMYAVVAEKPQMLVKD